MILLNIDDQSKYVKIPTENPLPRTSFEFLVTIFQLVAIFTVCYSFLLSSSQINKKH